MSDIIDRASKIEAQFRQGAINAQLINRQVSFDGLCLDCEQKIEPIRFKKYQACRCLNCQRDFETKRNN